MADNANELFESLSRQLNLSPEQIKSSCESGNTGGLLKNADSQTAQQVESIMSDPEKTRELLNSPELMSAMTKLAPLMSAAKPNDETAALLTALKPFLSGEKLQRLQSAQKLISLIKIIPLIKDSGLFL